MPNIIFQSQYDGGDAVPVAQYFLAKSQQYGDLITNLKMQKLVYYAYSGVLVTLGENLFTSRLEAWPNGPVVRPLYGHLKQYGYSPIPPAFLGDSTLEDIRSLFTDEQAQILDNVFVRYGSMSAFELVVLTHAEDPWKTAREDLAPNEPSTKRIEDSVIHSTYSADDFTVEDAWAEF